MKKYIVLITVVFALSVFAKDKTKTISLSISGMTCQSCASTVEKALKGVSGVTKAKVDLNDKKATVTYASAKTSTSSLIKAVVDAGFDAHEGKAGSKTELKKQSKSDGEECEDDCCGDEGDSHSKSMKTKKSETKKS
ncbi:MAG: heavy metal-associated domain-containing protein [Bacteroidota bacterium]